MEREYGIALEEGVQSRPRAEQKLGIASIWEETGKEDVSHRPGA